MPSAQHEIWLMRHGETEWSLSGQHTSRTDLPLTAGGQKRALHLKEILQGKQFALTLSSPMKRAIDTCRLAGYEAEISPDLHEWDYGEYEGLTTPEIQRTNPQWTIWTGQPPGGESIEQVGARADRVIQRALQAAGDVALFGHGHMLRVLGARWPGFAPVQGRALALSTGSLGVLGWEHSSRVIRLWNRTA